MDIYAVALFEVRPVCGGWAGLHEVSTIVHNHLNQPRKVIKAKAVTRLFA